MQRLSLGRLACGLVLGLGLLLPAQALRADEKAATNQERVKFDTVDQVELHGTFFPSSKGQKAPCAILLHELGGSSQKEGWTELATELQKKGFAVLTFDFRGHGDSTEVGSNFWQDRVNQTLKGARSLKSKDKVTYKDFSTPLQYSMMVNDIAAAKRFLDRKNDSGECNSADVVVIGAESGATLGALWIFTEWSNRPPIRNPLGFVIGQGEPQGKNVAAAVWLSMSPNLGTGKVNVGNWLKSPVREKIPMYFLVGEGDKNAGYSKYLHDSVLRANTDKSLKFTGMKAIPGSNKLAGRELLGKKSLGTEALIAQYLEKVMDDRGTNVWAKREVDKNPLARVPVEQVVR